MRGNALMFSCLGFIGGVAVSTIVTLVSGEILFLFLLAASCILLAFYVREAGARRGYLLLACFLFAAALGVVRYLDTRQVLDPYLSGMIGSRVTVEGVMFEEPVQRLNSTAITLELESVSRENSKSSAEGKILLSVERTYALRYGDRIRAKGVLAFPRSFETENGRTFDYPKYLETKGIFVLMDHPYLEVIASGQGNPLRQKLFALKNLFLEALSRVLSEPESTLLAGLLLGSEGTLPQEVQDSFRIAGLSHIVVLSGYNITLVADASMKLLSFLPLLVRLGAGSLAIILFVLMVGGGPAAVRAAIMAILVLVARGSGRTYAAGHALLLAGTAMVALDPKILLGDVSFQLSFLATAGLIYGSPIMERLLNKVPELYGLKALAVSTLSAQLFVLPLILYHSGIFSVMALPANLAVLPSVPLAMFLGALLGVVALCVPVLSLPLSFATNLVLKYEISAAKFFAALPGSYFLVPEFSSVLLLALYSLGAVCVSLWHLQAKRVPQSEPAALSS